MVKVKKPKHTVGQLVTWELRDYRDQIERAIAKTREGNADHYQLQRQLAEVVTEQEERRVVAEPNEFIVDTGQGYKVTGRAEVDGDHLDIVLKRADGQPFAEGDDEFSVTLSIKEDLT